MELLAQAAERKLPVLFARDGDERYSRRWPWAASVLLPLAGPVVAAMLPKVPVVADPPPRRVVDVDVQRLAHPGRRQHSG